MPWIERFICQAADGEADVVCFPECYVPGLRGQDFQVDRHDPADLVRARDWVCALAAQYRIGVIMPMEWNCPHGILNVAFVVSREGRILGYQTKNQLAPEEDSHYIPGNSRRLFALDGLSFGISICHEGWRYPETVRWSAVRGAAVVFHPHHAGSESEGVCLDVFGASDSPYYERAMMCRALENGIFFASVGYALQYQEAATALISPEGDCVDHLPYGQPGVLFSDINPNEANGRYARRFAASAYKDQ